MNDTVRRAELVEQALDVDADGRMAFLDVICAGNPTLKVDIQRLLALADSADGFLEGQRDAARFGSLPPGHTVDRYVIETLIGAGGMGAVYQARDPTIGRRVAVKVLRATHASSGQRARFLEEVRALGSFHHERVVRVYDAGEHDGHPYFVTELLEGEDLGKAIAGRHCGDLTCRLEIAMQAADALRAVHAAGFVHCDVKPSNLFITLGGDVKLLDFGIARAIGPTALPFGPACGTPRYMAPEQVRGEGATPSSDVFAFGLLLFELVSGRPAYRGDMAEVLEQVLHDCVPVSDLAESCPRAIVDIISGATAKQPTERIGDFNEVLRQLKAVRLQRRLPRLSGVRAATVAVFAVAGLSAVWWLRGSALETSTAPVQQQSPVAAIVGAQVDLGLLLEDSTGGARPITTPTLALQNSDRFRLVATPTTPGHFYVFSAPVDGSSLHVLFPSATSYAGSSRVESGRPTQIPETSWLQFEPRPGRERLWVAWSRTPYAPFEDARQWANAVDRGRVRDAASRARLESALAGKTTLGASDDGRLVLRGSSDLLIGVLDIQHH